MVSRQYEFHYNMALVMAEHLKRAGFKTDLDGGPGDAGAAPQRSQAVGHLRDAPGQFPSPCCRRRSWATVRPAVEYPRQESGAGRLQQRAGRDQARAASGKVQELVYHEVPFVEVEQFNGLSARSASLRGYTPAIWPFFWNTSLAAR
ncbi:Dipeptide-binding ABC transporter, periplasmic substrate-binding component OS=Castellaniella defragrans(strain DSM / CCUG 39792 / 65Phen) OX=1437824 GN=BN940_01691 PE=4 SV=1 [Castellaniella denitrificans]